MKLSEWNKGWTFLSKEQVQQLFPEIDMKFDSTSIEVNGDYSILTAYANSHFNPSNKVRREVYCNGEVVKLCVGFESGYSAARKAAYNHWKDSSNR